jgi:sulfur-carrier protein adenylyltransferase/sulfurtransferase
MAKTFKQIMDEARREIPEVSVEDVRARLEREPAIALLDVREKEEYRQGHLVGALSLPRGFLEILVEETVPDIRTPIVAYCVNGTRALIAARTLKEMGYADVVSMTGGFTAWKNAGLPFRQDHQFSQEQLTRYSRHLMLPEVGEVGQAKLLAAKVLLLGAGGLGSPTALYLAAAGVGTIGIVDDDVVDVTNLQRQVLHTTAAVGRPKTESGAATLAALNPDVKVVRHDLRLDSSNVMDVLAPYDVIVDGCDNFTTKYLVNDAAVLSGKTNVFGSIYRFDGQASVFTPGKGPCYRCLFPEPTPAELAPSCDEAGVLGVLPGVIGLVQATEAIKAILGVGTPLVGRLLTYDALAMTFKEYRVRRDPRCALCGDAPTIREVADLAWSCHFEPKPREETVGA